MVKESADTRTASRAHQGVHDAPGSLQPSITRPVKGIVGGLILSSAVALLAYKKRSLNRSGVAGAITTGTTIFGLGGIRGGLSLIFFFVSSSFLSHFRAAQKEETAADKFSKGSQRDLGQVVANGGVAALLAAGYGLSGSTITRELLEAGYVGALATANADTWATELGVLSQQPPRLITTWQETTAGTSGGITGTGTLAAAAGAFSLGVVFQALTRKFSLRLPLLALVSGIAGSFFDSWLGATVQSIYYCPSCQKETERHVHSCGTETRPLRGLPWMDNDVVNLLATLIGAISSMGIMALLQTLPRLFKR